MKATVEYHFEVERTWIQPNSYDPTAEPNKLSEKVIISVTPEKFRIERDGDHIGNRSVEFTPEMMGGLREVLAQALARYDEISKEQR